MSGPRAEELALLGHPTWRDALQGALYIWGVFTVTVGVVTAAVLAIMGGPTALPLVLLFFVFAAGFAGMVGGVLSLTWGLVTGMLLARALRGIRGWKLHAAAYFALGVLTALLVVTLYAVAYPPPERGLLADPFWAIAAGLMAVTGLSVVAGWALAWRAAARRARRVPA